MIKRAIIVLAGATLIGIAAVPAKADMRFQTKPCVTSTTVSEEVGTHSRVSAATACGGGNSAPGSPVSFEEVSEALWAACGRDDVAIRSADPTEGVAAAGALTAAGACYMARMYGGSGDSPAKVAAARAVADLDIEAPEIGLTGYGRPESIQVLGLPTWMWLANPGASTTGPVTSTAADGGVTVTATGRVRETVWQMGDGAEVRCTGANAAGTPYDKNYGALPSPTCGYKYGRTSTNEPDKAFTVQVTVYWDVAWSGGGEAGMLSTSVTRSTRLRVGEVQVITDERGAGR